MSFEIIETIDDYIVKTPNFRSHPIPEVEAIKELPLDSPILRAIESPYMDVHFGRKNGGVTVRQWTYSKQKYSEDDVQRISRQKLFKCSRCISNHESRVGEKRMAYVNYLEVGKEVLVAGIGGTIGGAVHFMFLAPQFAGQQLMGVKTTTIVDGIIAFVVAIATKMYARGVMSQIAGYGVAATLLAIGVLDQLGVLTTAPSPPVARLPSFSTPIMPTQAVPRASYLAPPGIVVNKHGTVPEIAPGTFG